MRNMGLIMVFTFFFLSSSYAASDIESVDKLFLEGQYDRVIKEATIALDAFIISFTFIIAFVFKQKRYRIIILTNI